MHTTHPMALPDFASKAHEGRTDCAKPDVEGLALLPTGSQTTWDWSGTAVKEIAMSGTDKMKNKAEELGGKGKEAVGDATDNRDLQAEGKSDQTKGNLKQAGEKVKDVFK
jgi:uncharacterized protein YjbJ (UPF0337 family)